jgi:class 3 adenylate cyclase/TolB-like protein/Tfp pilus assembly protein PilF
MSETRKIAAILAADVVGYSRLTGADEDRTLARLRALRSDLIDPTIAVHHGRVVKRTGDGALVEVRSVVDAVRCAIEVQNGMAERNAGVPAERRIDFRIGIHLGDIVEESDGDLMGDGINIAARLEGIAKPGAICLSEDAYRQVKARLSLAVSDLGATQLKNIAEPIRVYSLEVGAAAQAKPTTQNEPAELDPSALLALPDKPSIAVPFARSGDPEQEYFSDGIRGHHCVSRLRWFSSSPELRSSTKAKPSTARRVRYVLEGVFAGGQRVYQRSAHRRMMGNHLGGTFDRELTDIFALQDEITTSVTAAIEPKLLAAEGMRAETRPLADLNAWDTVARALSHFWKLTAAESETAVTMLKQAVQQFPRYPPAHSMFAFALLVSGHVGWRPTGKDAELAAKHSRIASELDDSDPWAHLALGYLAFVGRKTDEAVGCFRTALNLNPNFAAAHGFVGWALAFDGRSDEAIGHLQQAIRMSPRDPLNGFFLAGLSASHYLAGRYTEAVEWARQAAQIRGGILGAHRILCASLAQAGLIEEAKAAMNHLRQLQPGISIDWITQSVPYTPEPMAHFLEGMRKAGLQ